MIQEISLGTTPYDEQCSQVGDVNYASDASVECRTLISQLKREYERAFARPIPHKLRFVVSAQAHDLGTYYDVLIKFDDTDNDATDAAYWFDDNVPPNWDETSLRELRAAGYGVRS